MGPHLAVVPRLVLTGDRIRAARMLADEVFADPADRGRQQCPARLSARAGAGEIDEVEVDQAEVDEIHKIFKAGTVILRLPTSDQGVT